MIWTNGLTKETVSREINTLKRNRIIRLDALDILDRAGLALRAEAAA